MRFPTASKRSMPENPFFVLEVRRGVRRLGRTLSWLAAALCGTLALMGLVQSEWIQEPETLLDVLMFSHAVACAAVVEFHAERRVLRDDALRGSLPELLILPVPPGRWLLARLVYPALTVALAWAAFLPLYVVLVLQGFAGARALAGAWAVLGCGLALLPISLLIPLDSRRWTAPAAQLQPSAHVDLQVRSIASFLAYGMLVVWFWRGLIWGYAASWPFFDRLAPLAAVTGAALAVLVPACALSVLQEVSTAPHAARLAAAARAGAACVLFVLLLGLMWGSLPDWLRWPVALLPAAAAGLWSSSLRRARKAGSAAGTPERGTWTERELAWLVRRWQNPVWIRDLRGISRRGLLRERFLEQLVAAGITVALYGVLRPAPLTREFDDAMAVLVVLFGPWGVTLWTNIRCSAMWTRERRAGTLPLLLATPLPPEEVYWGRVLAATVSTWVPSLPWLVLWGVSVGWVLSRGLLGAGLMSLALLPLWLTLVQCGVHRPPERPSGPDERFEFTLALVQMAVNVGLGAWMAFRREPSLLDGVLCLLAFTLNAAVGWWLYRLYLRRYEQLRQ